MKNTTVSKNIGPMLFLLFTQVALAVAVLFMPNSVAMLCVFIAVGVLTLLTLFAHGWGNIEYVGTLGKLYGRIKISNSPYYMINRYGRKSTQWFELGYVENLDGTARVYTITIISLTAQLGWTGERTEKESEEGEREYTFTYKKDGRTVYTGPDMPQEMIVLLKEMEQARAEMFEKFTPKNKDTE